MDINRITRSGYLAVAGGNASLLKRPRVLGETPVQLSAGVGFVYFVTSLLLLRTGGVPKEYYLPVLGILAAFCVFIYRSVTLVAERLYKLRLKRYEQRGVVVFVPSALLHHAQSMYKELGQEASNAIFDADVQKTSELVRLYKKEGYSSKTELLLRGLVSS